MKRKFTLLFLAVGTIFTAKSQLVLSEDFNDPFTPGAGTNEWVIVDNTVPGAGGSWAQGNQTGGNGTVTAFNGSTDDFYMADFTAVNGSVGDISAFLITPTVTIYNGAEIKFATRTMQFSGAALYPDRMQVLMSQSGSSVIPTGTASVGSFTDILLDINPNLTQGTSSVVSNGTVNGYPQSWVVYTIPITNVTGTVTGRFAFRYFVKNGGAGGGNSRLVALDAVRYTLPCGPTVQSYTTCAGFPTILNAINGTGVTTYSWDTGATTSSVSVIPGATTVYSLFPSIGGSVSCGNAVTATVTISNQLSVLVSSNQTLVCAGTPVVLTATSPATSYSWTTGGTTSLITVTPTITTTYSVGAMIGAIPNVCVGGNTITVQVNPSPTISATTANTLVCTTGATATTNFTATGTATLFGWFNASSGAILGTGQTFAVPVPTINGATGFTVGLIGFDANDCSATIFYPLTLALKPTFTTAVNKSPTCIGNSVEFSAVGADNYTWTAPGGTLTGNGDTFSIITGTTTGNRTYTVVGDNADGCTTSKGVVLNVTACTSIEKVDGDNALTNVFPNPFSNQLTLSGISGKVMVFNAIGQKVLNLQVSGNDETIDTSSLPKGAYILKAYDANGLNNKTIKLIKN